MARQRASAARNAFARIGAVDISGAEDSAALSPTETAPDPLVPADPQPASQPLLAAVSAKSLPAPYAGTGSGDLSVVEQGHLAVCEEALDELRKAFWLAGKALQVIRDARLYRQTHATFESYLAERWDMGMSQAYRLIDAWPLAERLSPIGEINESQIRELVPLAAKHGQDAAVTVYSTIAETNGTQVTAAMLKGAVSVLPADHFDADEAVAQIRAYLAGAFRKPAPVKLDPLQVLTAEVAKLLQNLNRRRDTLIAAAHADPNAMRETIKQLRAAADELEKGSTA